MAGAAVIAAVTNALEGRGFPFVFGGDGASFAVSPDDLERAREALAATAAGSRRISIWSMRVALVPVAAIRGAGLDVRVARFGPSPNLVLRDVLRRRSRLGRGRHEAGRVRGAGGRRHPAGSLGLSCRFEEIPSARGLILSVLVVPARGADPHAFRELIEDVITLVGAQSGRRTAGAGAAARRCDGRRPASNSRRAPRAAGRCSRGAAYVLARTLFAYLIMRFGISVGGFVPEDLHPAGGGEFRFPQI